ncbi:MAG: hypothetical protein U0704_01920 [Candidatus Eisenbacteria bacterium]
MPAHTFPGTARPLPALAAALVLSLAALPACAANAPDSAAARPATPPAPAAPPARCAALLLLDPADLGFGTSVVYDRIPGPRDLNELAYLSPVSHVVLQLPAWPESWDAIRPLQDYPLPEGADLVVLLPGWPPSRAATEAWNYLRRPLRVVLLVDGPPADRGLILELNSMRGLERVVADMEHPARTGFERLQRPLSFRVVKR